MIKIKKKYKRIIDAISIIVFGIIVLALLVGIIIKAINDIKNGKSDWGNNTYGQPINPFGALGAIALLILAILIFTIISYIKKIRK